MNDALSHRGPDGEGFATFEPKQAGSHWLGLAHRRLIIRDHSPAAAQPLSDPSGRYTLIYNGEIYNHDELRSELGQAGYSFRSSGDTEVLLHAWSYWGTETPSRLDGEFVFGIYDAESDKFYLCRDRLGIKPLYVFSSGSQMAFSSELRGLRSGPWVDEFDKQAISYYLAFGSIPEPMTPFRNISVFPAGTLSEISLVDLSQRSIRYWENPYFHAPSQTPLDLMELDFLLRDAVRKRLVSDVPLGVFLSGGMDSSCLVAVASKHTSGSLRTFTLDFEGTDDGACARTIADRFGTDHAAIPVFESEAAQSFPDWLQSMDCPSIDGLNSYLVCKAAKNAGITVALSGLGADEVFAGYPFFHRLRPFLNLSKAFSLLKQPLAAAFNRMASNVKQEKLAALFKADATVCDFYAVTRALFLDGPRKQLSSLDLTLSERIRLAVPAALKERDSINLLCGLETEFYLKAVLLRDIDAMSMIQSLEVRPPFLGHHIIDWLARIPGASKISPRMNKPLLANTLGRDLPEKILTTKKRGFQLPIEKWMQTIWAKALREAFEGASVEEWESLGLSPNETRAIYRRFVQGDRKIAWYHVWALYVLKQWSGTAVVCQQTKASVKMSL